MHLHASALSEPLFFFFVLASLWFLTDHLCLGTTRALLLAASFASAALLTRFAGAASVATVSAAAAVWAPESRLRRLRGAIVAGIIGIVPSLLVSLYTSDVLHGEGSREIAGHVVWTEFRTIGEVASSWFLPSSLDAGSREILVAVAFAALTTAYLVSGHRRSRDREATMLVRVLVLFAVAYTVVVVLSRDFLDVSIPIDARILSPLQPVAYLLAVALAAPVMRTWSATRRRVGVAGLAGLLGLIALQAVAPTIDFVRVGPQRLEGSPGGVALDALRRLPPDALVVTLLAGWVSQYTGRATIRLPNRLDGLTNRPNPHFDADVREAAEILERRPSTYVFLYPGAAPGSFAGATDLARYVPLGVVTPLPQGGAILAPVASG
jgi:hypothetical protein